MRETHRAFDARLQAGRRRRARKPLAQNPAQGVGVNELRGQQRIGCNLPADRECVRRIKLAVRVRVNQKGLRFAGVGAGQIRHVSLFDGSNCGIALKDRPVFSVQYHPEASPGPRDSHYLFTRFVDMRRKPT